MKTIYKYQLEITLDVQIIEMPVHAKILSAQNQNENPCMWVEVETTNDVEFRRFYVLGTGYPMPSNTSRFIGTIQINDLVFHLFELY
ncbi:hypothetical protein HHL23_09405 [Chryseobacterium sp. RP-3-3]|uniref:DUF7352 domain-containing protein n=1 Tax=Chryseobacterium antibioticum TaxID=2728847 RepID=A0A7Y0AMF3_9FLAO|nr:hypothetical protein [Chryseobacterium antibioticum]NML70016.1 hypothetical protein [Chryseobacterium antibioticum]